MSARPVVVVVAALALVAGLLVGGFLIVRQLDPTADRTCEATVEDHTTTLDLEEGAGAGLVAAVSVGERLPARAATIALTVALTDEDLAELPGGALAWARDFYPRLSAVQGYRELDVPEAAAAVTGDSPDRYADQESDARALASALTGQSPEAFTCDTRADFPEASDELNDNGLVPRAQAVLDDVQEVIGDIPAGGFAPEGVATGHIEGSAHYEGRAVDLFFRPVTPANQRHGWAVAHYLVSQTERLKVATVIFDDRIWSSGSRSGQGWRDYEAPDGPGDRAILEHRDHVHVDVAD